MATVRGWQDISLLGSRDYRCGYCGRELASQHGYYNNTQNDCYIYICHFCNSPTFFYSGRQTPGSTFGEDVGHISDLNILQLYNEARSCMGVNAFTSAVLCCRKLLMHIAVSKGAKEGLKFIEYVEYLSANNYIPPGGKEWVDHIRSKGNEATHEIIIMESQDAEDLIIFVGMLLKFIYEFPEKVRQRKNPKK